MQSTHIQFAIKQAAAMALVASAAFGASTIEVTADNSPYALTADVTDVTSLSIAENCVLDLNGHDLAYNSSYGSGLNGLSGHACVITNSAASSTSTISFILNTDTSAFGDILSKVSFGFQRQDRILQGREHAHGRHDARQLQQQDRRRRRPRPQHLRPPAGCDTAGNRSFHHEERHQGVRV